MSSTDSPLSSIEAKLRELEYEPEDYPVFHPDFYAVFEQQDALTPYSGFSSGTDALRPFLLISGHSLERPEASAP